MPIIAAAGSGSALSLFVLFAIGFYFFPAVIAFVRKHRNSGAIFALNLLLGWTLLGWVASLVWALANPGQTVVVNQYVNPGDAGVNVRQPPQ